MRRIGIITAILATLLGTALTSSPAAAAAAADCEARGPLAVDGATVFTQTTEPGRSICYTFDGRTGQDLAIGLYIPLDDGTWRGYASRATVRDPSGVVVASYNPDSIEVTPTFRLPVPTLAQSGTYTLELAPIQPTSILRVSALVSARRTAGATPIDGPGLHVTYDRPGQDIDLHVPGTASQFVALRVADFAMTTRQPGANAGLWLEVHRAQSGAIAYRGVAFGNGDFTVGPLREDGDFTVRTWPLDGSQGQATINVVTTKP